MSPDVDQREQDREQPAGEQAEPELRERVVDGARREHEVERRPAGRPSADHEGGLTGDGLPRVAELPRVDDRLELGREPIERALRGGADAHGLPSPKSAMTSASPRRRNWAGRPLAPKVAASVGGGHRCREEDREVEVGLLAGVRDEPRPERRVDERVDADADGRDRQHHERDERDREAGAEAAHPGRQAPGRAAL